MHTVAQPFMMMLPIDRLVVTKEKCVVSLPARGIPLIACRCGFVIQGYIECQGEDKHDCDRLSVAVKVMDRKQVVAQRDDVEHEVLMMACLQHRGVGEKLKNDHMVRWECGKDKFNEYIVTEFVANGSLVSYAHKRVRELLVGHLHEFVKARGQEPSKSERLVEVYRPAGTKWIDECISILLGVARALIFMHKQRIAHLDLDVYNVAIDRNGSPRIIDLGSSQLMDLDGMAGAGDKVIKYKPAYVSPELRAHSQLKPPRPGFRGERADAWALGAMVRCALGLTFASRS
jgi:5'-AMP-activated protein kinase catalytic alpha subunit